jgi:hypothetical protein
MTFFYELNQKLNSIGTESTQLTESKKTAKSPVRQVLETTLEQDLKKLWEDGTGGANFSGSGSLEEKWAGGATLNPKKKGMFKGKTKADLEKELADLHKSGPHKKGTPEYTKQQELNFAIRAKSDWKKGVNETDVTIKSPPPGYEQYEKEMAELQRQPDRSTPQLLALINKYPGCWNYDASKTQNALAQSEPEDRYRHVNENVGIDGDMMEDEDEFELPSLEKLGKSKTNPSKLQAMLDRQAEKKAQRGFDDFDFVDDPRHSAKTVRSVTFNRPDTELDDLDEAIPMTLEGSMKHTMMTDAERMSLRRFCDLYGDEAWVKEFWYNADGRDMGDEHDELEQMMEYLKRKAQREDAHMVAVNDTSPAHAGIEFEEDGPHGKPQWLIDAQKRAEHRRGRDVEECDMYESAKPVYIRKSKLAENDDMTKNQIHTIRRAARALESIVRADEEVPEWVKSKITIANDYLKTVRDYLESAMERSVERVTGREGVTSKLGEKITKKTSAGEIISDFEKSKNPKFAGKSKAERKKQALGAFYGMHPEKSKNEDAKKDDKAERAGKRVAKDIEYDERVKDEIHGKKRDSEDSKAERAGKRVAKDIEYDEKKTKAKKVKETTTAGSVAPTAAKSTKGSSTVGKGIYDSIDRQVESMISESIDVDMSKRFDDKGEETSSINIGADGAEADMLKDLLKNAGIGVHSDQHDMARDYEGEEDTFELELDEADVDVSENNPDYPTNNEFSDDSLQYSGGLNGRKSTRQTTVPVIASQDTRQMSEERSMFDLYKAITERT